MEIKERIITEAGALFGRYGIKSVTMDTLAVEMGVSKRTIYENFRDKDELLLKVIKFFKLRQIHEANEVIRNSDNVIVALFSLLRGMINTSKQVNPLFFQDMKKYHSHIFRQLEEDGDLRDHSVTRKILNDGIQQGIFKSTINLELVNLAIHEMFNMFSPDSAMTTKGYDRAEMFNNIMIPYLTGLATEKGKILIEAQGKIRHDNQE
jgi:TetR/AcrR family transcriptional regulator, cholesterol catabolism regulator